MKTPALATLAEHFTTVIHQISDGKWYHLPSKWTSKGSDNGAGDRHNVFRK